MKTKEFHEAIILRKKGYSLTEISRLLNVSKSTASIWVRDLRLSGRALERLKTCVTKGQMAAAESKRNKTKLLLKHLYQNSRSLLKKRSFDKNVCKLFCSLLYWCEGGRYDNRFIQFTNSDELIVKAFLHLLRKSFGIDESKFRACIHLHPYHSVKKQTIFWSKVTGFSENLFIQPFRKQNTGKRIKENYQGCLQIRYYDSNVARDLLMTGKALLEKLGA